MDCGICGKEYKSWDGLFYHKRKVHNCENVHSRRYDYETKNAAKIAAKITEEKSRKCIHCHKHHLKPAMEKRYLKSHKEDVMWIECKLCRKEHREEMFKDHIRGHNRYMRDEYHMKPDELEELVNIVSYDAALTAA